MDSDDTRSRTTASVTGIGALALVVAGGCLAPDGRGGSPEDDTGTVESAIASAAGGVAWARVAGGATPSIVHSHNSSGDPITVARSGPGIYTIGFAGQGHDLATNQGNIQVVAVGDNAVRCSAGAMSRGGAPGPRRTIAATVRCLLPGGAGGPTPADSDFVVLYVQDRVGGSSSSRGYALVQDGALVAARTFAPTSVPVEIIPWEEVPGSYYLAFGGAWPAGGVVPVVTAYGQDEDLECHTTDFFPETGELFVGCFDSGVPAEGDFSVLLMASPPAPAPQVADTFHYVPDPENPFPTTGYPRFVPEGGPFGTPGPIGGYVLQYLFGTSPQGVLPVVGSLSPGGEYCKVMSYQPTTPSSPTSDFNLAQLVFRCFDGTGAPAPSELTAAFVINGPVIIW
jgi:hypothetical protein